jgi:hypothetical protein
MRCVATQRRGPPSSANVPHTESTYSIHFEVLYPRWVSRRWYPTPMPRLPATHHSSTAIRKAFQLKTNSAATAPAWKTIMKKVVTHITGCLNVRSRLKNPGFRIMSPILYEPRSVFSGVRRKLNKEPGKAAVCSIDDGSQTVLQAGQHCTVSEDSRRRVNRREGGAHLQCQRREVLESLASRGIQICKVGLSQLPQTVVMVPHLLAKRDTKGEESCMWRTSLRTNHMWSFPHVSPDLYCRSIHVQKPYSVTTLTPQAVDANRP